MKLYTLQALFVIILALSRNAESKLESGAIYEIQLFGGRVCPQDDGYLGFFNRTCGALSPKSVGPSLRSSSVETWRQWQVVVVDETETEQWGYLVAYYPEDRGEARCVGSIVTLSSTCSDSDSKVATIDSSATGTLFRFTPLEDAADTYRIILKDREGKGCHRFLSGTSDCSVDAVGFAKNDLGKGLQRWVMTKVADGGSPTPSPTPTSSPTPSPSPTQPSVPAPTITAAYGTSFLSANVTIVSPDASVTACTVVLTPGGVSLTVAMPSYPGMATASFTQLAVATSYEVTASCELSDGGRTLSSKPVVFKTLGGSYNPPPPGSDTTCDGRGETVDENGQCICDAYNVVEGPFKSNGNGGCTCFDDAEDLGYGPCICPQYTVNCYEGCCPAGPPATTVPPPPTTVPPPEPSPLCQISGTPYYTLLASGDNMPNFPYFGTSAATNADGTVVVVGDATGEVGIQEYKGTAYVYRFDGSDFVEDAALSAPDDVGKYTGFGTSVAINAAGNLIVIGDYDGNTTTNGGGRAYIYRYDGSNWNREKVLSGDPAITMYDFGNSAALNDAGNVLVVGDPAATPVGNGDFDEEAGAVFVYRHDGSDWVEEDQLFVADGTSTNDDEDGYFGYSVDINADGTIIAIGSYGADVVGTDNDNLGRTYIYRYDGSNWNLEDSITGSNTATDGDRFGWDVALNDAGDVLVVSDYKAEDNLGPSDEGGLVYVFRHDGSDWVEEAILDKGDGWDSRFGVALAINWAGDVIAVGEKDRDNPGRVHIFTFDGTSWNRDTVVESSSFPNASIRFGNDVALDATGEVLFVGDRQGGPDSVGQVIVLPLCLS